MLTFLDIFMLMMKIQILNAGLHVPWILFGIEFAVFDFFCFLFVFGVTLNLDGI